MITSSLTLNKYNLSFTNIDLFIMVLRVTAREKKSWAESGGQGYDKRKNKGT